MTYIGAVCSKCGNKERYNGGTCVNCKRADAAARAAATFDGKPCMACGATLRYRVRRNCVACAKARAERQRQGRAEVRGTAVVRTFDTRPRCSRCSILLAMVPHDGAKCSDCLGVEARYRDVVPYEYVPEVVTWS